MTITKLALTSALTALAAGAAIAAAPIGAAANVDAGPIVAGPTAPSAIDAAPAPDSPMSGPVALAPGGPVAVLPQAALGGGANPYVPNGTDPSSLSASGHRDSRNGAK
jgi:hypothetical protein